MSTITANTERETLVELAVQANQLHRKCVDAQRAAAEYARDCGDILIQVKARLPHGKWGNWLAQHCSFAARNARRYMKIAAQWDDLQRLAGAKGTRASVLTIRAALGMLTEVDDQPLVVGEATRHCSSCGSELARTSRRWATCIACWECRLFPADADQSPQPDDAVDSDPIRVMHEIAEQYGFRCVEQTDI